MLMTLLLDIMSRQLVMCGCYFVVTASVDAEVQLLIMPWILRTSLYSNYWHITYLSVMVYQYCWHLWQLQSRLEQDCLIGFENWTSDQELSASVGLSHNMRELVLQGQQSNSNHPALPLNLLRDLALKYTAVLVIWLSSWRTIKVLISLHGRAGWSAPLLFTYSINMFCHNEVQLHCLCFAASWTVLQTINNGLISSINLLNSEHCNSGLLFKAIFCLKSVGTY